HQLVEAGERLRAAVGVPQLVASHAAIWSKDEEDEERSFESSAAGAIDAGVRPGYEQRIGALAKDIVDAVGDRVGDLEQGAEPAQVGIGAPRALKPERAVVDELDVGRDRPSPAIEIDGAYQRLERARRRRGARTIGTVGEELGVALVQPDD